MLSLNHRDKEVGTVHQKCSILTNLKEPAPSRLHNHSQEVMLVGCRCGKKIGGEIGTMPPGVPFLGGEGVYPYRFVCVVDGSF